MGILDFLSAGAAGAGVAPPSASTIAMQGPARKFGVKDIFGILGDALLQGNDMEPAYANRLRDEEISNAAALLNDPNTESEGLRRIFGIDSKTGVQVQKNLIDQQKLRAEAQAKADLERKTALELGRTQALNQLKAGVPREVVEAAAAKRGVDLSDIPTDPKILDKYLRGTLDIKDQYAIEDKEADNQRDRAYKEADIALKGGRLTANTNLAAGRLVSGSNLGAGRLTKTTSKSGGKSGSSAKPAGKIRINQTTGKIEYLQPDGSYK